MEYKRIWLKYGNETKFDGSNGMINAQCFPIDNNETTTADNEIKAHLNNGWKIVSTCPVTASNNILNPQDDDVYFTFTSGIEVFMVKD